MILQRATYPQRSNLQYRELGGNAKTYSCRLYYRELGRDDEQQLPIRAMYKSEIAAYFGVHPATISRWIARHHKAFKKIGYHKNLKMLDPGMVKLFSEIFC